ncbi:MAG: hypothetical protein WBA93_33510 [Microcoleaceae cyanobacterium]
MLKTRFSELERELLVVVETLLKLSADEYAQRVLQISNLSRSELLELINR